MTVPPNPKNSGSPSLWSSEKWAELRSVGLQAARYFSCASQAEDIVQEALLRVLTAEAMGHQVQNYHSYVRGIVRNAVRTQHRKVQVAKKYAEPSDPSEQLSPEESYTRGTPGLQRIATELGEVFQSCAEGQAVFDYLFSSVALFDDAAALQQHTQQEMPSSRTSFRRRATEPVRWSLLPRTVRSQVSRLIADLVRRNISVSVLCTVLQTPSILLSCPELTLMIAAAAKGVIQLVQDTSKQCRLDILMRIGIDRQDIHVTRLPLFAQDLDNLYAAARMPRAYTLLGMITYLEDLFKTKTIYQNIIDHNYIENIVLNVINNKPKIQPMDRWLAIVCLGVLYEQADAGLSYIEKILSPIEHTTQHHPVQKIGAAFAWMDAMRRDKHLMLRDKVYPLLDPENWPGGLSQLPITAIGSYMGAEPAILQAALAIPNNWLPILYGLQSKSYMANLGALAQLTHMPYHEPPSSIRTDIKTALHRVQSSTISLIYERTRLVPFRYWGEE